MIAVVRISGDFVAAVCADAALRTIFALVGAVFVEVLLHRHGSSTPSGRGGSGIQCVTSSNNCDGDGVS